MNLKKFEAPSVREALLLVKEELGSQAVIIRTEKKGTLFEVTAALDDSQFVKPEKSMASERIVNTYSKKGTLNSLKKPKVTEAVPSGLSHEIELLRHEFSEFKANMTGHNFEKIQNVPSEFRPMASQLLDGGMCMEFVADIIAEIAIQCPMEERQHGNIQRLAIELVAKKLPVVPGIELKEGRSTCVLFAGPTGVGKSTTIAKLAAQQVLSGIVEVGIISTDCYRMGAIEQMHVFTQTASIDFISVFEMKELDKALLEFKNKDLILIDTAGRSNHHQEHFNELVDIYKRVKPDEVHLVLATNTRDRDLEAYFNQYSKIGLSRLSYTKVDETLELSSIYNLAVRHGIPISLVCNGQNIPDDIFMADPAKLAKMIVTG